MDRFRRRVSSTRIQYIGHLKDKDRVIRNHCLVINPKKRISVMRMWRKFKRTVLLHDGQELDNDLGGRADQDLALASLLGVVDSIEAIVENGSLDHFGGCRGRFSMAIERLRYLQRNCG
jgi:hypothetical protein